MDDNNREGARNSEKDKRNKLVMSPLLLGPLLGDTPVVHQLIELLLSQSWAPVEREMWEPTLTVCS